MRSLTIFTRAAFVLTVLLGASGNVLAMAAVTGQGNPKVTRIYTAGAADVSLGAGASTAASVTDSAIGNTSSTGGGQPHSTMSPFLGVRCIIAIQGIFPSRD